MAREPIKKVQKELERDEMNYYGESHPAGGSEQGGELASEMDADEVLESVTGDKINDEEGKPRPLNIARRIDGDEDARDDEGFADRETYLEKTEKGEDDTSDDNTAMDSDEDELSE